MHNTEMLSKSPEIGAEPTSATALDGDTMMMSVPNKIESAPMLFRMG